MVPAGFLFFHATQTNHFCHPPSCIGIEISKSLRMGVVSSHIER